MTNRTIPYGYAIINGEVTAHPLESQVVRRIFADYLGGESLQAIALALDADKVEFLPNRSDWNKNRVKRILEDKRYTGADTYPAIIGEDMHRRAQVAKQLRTKNGELIIDKSTGRDGFNSHYPLSTINYQIKCPVICTACGTKMKRRHDSRRKITELWQCQYPDCRKIVDITDVDLYGEATKLLSRLIASPDIIKAESAASEPPLPVKRLENEIDRQLESLDFDREKLKADIFNLAAEKYKHIDNTPYISQMLRAEFAKMTPLPDLSHELFKRTVLKIQLGDDGVRLILKNNQTIGKEQQNYADSNNTAGSPTDKDSTDDPRQA